MHRVDIDAKLKVRKGLGHKVKGQGQINSHMKKNCLVYSSSMNYLISIKLTHVIDSNAIWKVTQGQGLEVKDQGQQCNYVKKFSWV